MIPIQVKFQFDAKIRRGIRMRHGWTQEVKFAYRGLNLQLGECWVTLNEKRSAELEKLKQE